MVLAKNFWEVLSFTLLSLFLLGGGSSRSFAEPLPPALQSVESYCICQATLEDKPLKLRKCQDKFKDSSPHITVNENYTNKGFQGYSYEMDYNKIPSREFCYWKYLGTPFPGQHLIYSIYNGGGSGVFTTLALLERDGDTLQATQRLEGGDRANGGVSDPMFTKGKLVYQKALTPAALMALGRELSDKAKQVYATLPLKDLMDCANCWVGNAVFETDFKKTRLVKVVLQRNPVSASQKAALQKALDLIMDLYLKGGKTELLPKEFDGFIEEVIKSYEQPSS